MIRISRYLLWGRCTFAARNFSSVNEMSNTDRAINIISEKDIKNEMKIFKHQNKEFNISPRKLKYPSKTLVYSGRRLYRCVSELIDYEYIANELRLPDMMIWRFSNIVFLHVWMLGTVLVQAGSEGLFVRREMVGAMWEDLRKRVSEMARQPVSTRKKAMFDLQGFFFSHCFAYDEGFLSDDTMLAAALWREFFNFSFDVTAQDLERTVGYVRRQMDYLTNIPIETLLLVGVVKFLDFDSTHLSNCPEQYGKLCDIFLDENPGQYELQKKIKGTF